MRPLDRLIGVFMWMSIAATFPIIICVLANDVYKVDWRYTLGLCLLWLPPALSLGQAEDAPCQQPLLFYVFAGATFIWVIGLLVYGVFFYSGIP